MTGNSVPVAGVKGEGTVQNIVSSSVVLYGFRGGLRRSRSDENGGIEKLDAFCKFKPGSMHAIRSEMH